MSLRSSKLGIIDSFKNCDGIDIFIVHLRFDLGFEKNNFFIYDVEYEGYTVSRPRRYVDLRVVGEFLRHQH